jgi:hypothetical protein
MADGTLAPWRRVILPVCAFVISGHIVCACSRQTVFFPVAWSRSSVPVGSPTGFYFTAQENFLLIRARKKGMQVSPSSIRNRKVLQFTLVSFRLCLMGLQNSDAPIWHYT